MKDNMVQVLPLRKVWLTSLSNDYYQRSLRELPYILSSAVPSITPVDYSARIQSVSRKINLNFFWSVFNSFKKITGYALVANTSFHVRVEPIVCARQETYQFQVNYLVINNFFLVRSKHPIGNDISDWRNKILLDQIIFYRQF